MVGGPGQVLQDLRPVVEQLPLHRPLLVGRQILGDVHVGSRAGDGRLGALNVIAADVRVLRGVGGHRGGACESGAPALQVDGGGAVPAQVVEGAEHVGAAELHLAVDGDGHRAAPGTVDQAAIGQGGTGDDSASYLDGHICVGVAVALHLIAVHRRGHKGAVGDSVLLDVPAQRDLLAGGDAVGGPCGSLVDGDEGRLALLHLRFDGGDLRLLGPDLGTLIGDLGGVRRQISVDSGSFRLHHHGLLLLQDLQLALQLGQGGLLRLQLHMEQSVSARLPRQPGRKAHFPDQGGRGHCALKFPSGSRFQSFWIQDPKRSQGLWAAYQHQFVEVSMKKKWKFTKKTACGAARFLSLLATLFVLQWTSNIGLPGVILVALTCVVWALSADIEHDERC